jgi:hypothetical protein
MQFQLNRSRRGRTHPALAVLLATLACAGFVPASALAAPSAEIARKCIHYSYVAYPYKRPGSVRMSGDRQAYFGDCVAKGSDQLRAGFPLKELIILASFCQSYHYRCNYK